ncbi:hypothetical protein BH09ACT12_BH09ACT12_11770 [soil metagenome]
MKARVLVACALAVLLSGCSSTSDSDEPVGGASATPSSATNDPTEPTESPTSTLVPAAGKLLTVSDLDADAFSYRLPDGRWRLGYKDQGGYLDTSAGTWRINGLATAVDVEVGPRFHVKGRLQYWRGDAREPKQIADRTVDGVEGYVIEGAGPDGLLYEYGAEYSQTFGYIEFEFPKDTPKARAVIESVLASFEWQ